MLKGLIFRAVKLQKIILLFFLTFMQNSFVQNQTSFQVYSASAGSGKTFTLVKEYLRVLLQSEDENIFKKILAVTFTNKAAGEMKERILKNLLDFSKGNAENDMLQLISLETGQTVEMMQHKAERALHNILQNYSAFHIKTIDSFTNKIIRSFAFDLGLPLDFDVELDPDSILNETIDLVISKIGIDKELTKALVEFAIQKTLEDKSWDISRDLKEISKLLLKEDDAFQILKLEDKSISDFKILEKKLRTRQSDLEKQFGLIGEKGLEIINDLEIDHKDFYYSQFPRFFQNLITDPSKISFRKDKGIGKSIANNLFYTKGKPVQVKQEIDEVADILSEHYWRAEELFQTYFLNKLILKNLIPLAIINAISKTLEEVKANNNILLISEFNQIISKHLREQPAAFIYEKIGEKYRHFFIDEMQDTSIMQWNNLIPLIDNALSEENSSLLMVGDAKQAIYRWRGGKAEQFIDLSLEGSTKENNPFQRVKKLENLETNYRSYSQIIDFNNRFFSHISKYFDNRTYKELYKIGNSQRTTNKEGGFVQLNFIEECSNNEDRNELFPQEVYGILENLEGKFERNEICILVRKKSQGIVIANYLVERNIQIVSSETLLVKNNRKVDFIIQLLYLLKDENDGGAKLNVLYFLYDHLDLQVDKHTFIEEYIHLNIEEFYQHLEGIHIFYKARNFEQNPFYESIEEIIRSFKLAPESDAYLLFFLDFVFDFTQRKPRGNDNFLEYWEQKKEKLSIVASDNKNAVQIMTIHKSKGLEFPVVIYPYDLNIYYQKDPKTWFDIRDEETYNGFDSFLVSSSSAIENIGEIGEKIFKEQKSELELDNFNLLYVALTRAKEQLYILSENKKVTEQLKWYSNFFIDFLVQSGNWEDGKMKYEFGISSKVSKKEGDEIETEIQESFISTSWKEHSFNIVSTSSVMWDTDRGDAIAFGNIIHELMAGIIVEDDICRELNSFFRRGIIEKKQFDQIEKLVNEIVRHEQLKTYFRSGKTVYTEREIITEDNQIIIPDRLIFSDINEVVIIDYKTGKPDKKHDKQINNYGRALERMNCIVLEKLLVYIDNEINVIKV